MTTYKLPNHWLGHPLRVAVLGCGGTGYYIGTNLFMFQRVLLSVCPNAAFEQIDLYDGKNIQEPNLARTGYLPFEVGMNKADILAHRLNSALGCETFRSFNSNASTQLLRQGRYDLIITATDSHSSRAMVAEMAQYPMKKVLWLDTGVDRATASFVLGEVSAEDDRLPTSHDLFPTVNVEDKYQETSCDMQTSLARQAFGINQQIAGHAINLVSQLLLDGELSYHGGLLDMKSGITAPINVSSEVWASLGYRAGGE